MTFRPRSFLRSLTLATAALAATVAAHAQFTDEVPFITSPDNVTLEMLRIADVGRADHVIDLGSGDGRIVILAARRFGASGLGVEIDPRLVELSNRHARDAGVADRAVFREQDLFKTDLAPATVITMYLLPEFNLALRPALLQLKPGTRLVSHDWHMADWQPDQTTVVQVPNKQVGRDKFSQIHLWVVPARVDGLWCGNGALRGTSLRATQRFQLFDATLSEGTRSRAMQGRIAGSDMVLGDAGGLLGLQAAGDTLRVNSGPDALRGGTFQRATGAACG